MEMVDCLRSKNYIVCVQKAYLLPETKGRNNEAVRVAPKYRESAARYPWEAIFFQAKMSPVLDKYTVQATDGQFSQQIVFGKGLNQVTKPSDDIFKNRSGEQARKIRE